MCGLFLTVLAFTLFTMLAVILYGVRAVFLRPYSTSAGTMCKVSEQMVRYSLSNETLRLR